MVWSVVALVVLLSLRVFLVWGLKTVFPPRRDVGTRVGARTHTRRGETEWSTRRLCGELCGRALVAQSARRGGN